MSFDQDFSNSIFLRDHWNSSS